MPTTCQTAKATIESQTVNSEINQISG